MGKKRVSRTKKATGTETVLTATTPYTEPTYTTTTVAPKPTLPKPLGIKDMKDAGKVGKFMAEYKRYYEAQTAT